jgi:predicted RNase H-like HicB family nuclease
MRYPAAIELGNEDQAFGVIIPDLPGCFSAGDSLDEAMTNAEEAILLWIDVALDTGETIPQPSSVDAVRRRHPEWANWVWAVVEVNPAQLDDKTERVNITLPRRVLARLDAAAREAGETRSGYIARIAMEKKMQFGQFSGPNMSKEEDFAAAGWHPNQGDSDH